MKSPANINISGRKRIAQETVQELSKKAKPEAALQIQSEDGSVNFANEDEKQAMEEEPESTKFVYDVTMNTDNSSESVTGLGNGDTEECNFDDDIDPLHSDEVIDSHTSGNNPSNHGAVDPLNSNVTKVPTYFDDAIDSQVANYPHISVDAIGPPDSSDDTDPHHSVNISDPVLDEGRNIVLNIVDSLMEKVFKKMSDDSKDPGSDDSKFGPKTAMGIFQNISISLVGGNGVGVNLESLLAKQPSNIAPADSVQTDIQRIFQTGSGISIKKQSDKEAVTLDESSAREEGSEGGDDDDEDTEPAENLAPLYDNCTHGDGDLSDYMCADCTYNRWRCERDFARNSRVRKQKKTGTKIIDEVNWEEVFKETEVDRTEEHKVTASNPKVAKHSLTDIDKEEEKVEINEKEVKVIADNSTNPKASLGKIDKKEEKVEISAKDVKVQVNDPSNPKTSLGKSMEEILANSEYFSKYPKQIKKGSASDTRFDKQDPAVPEGWKYREFGRNNGRVDKEYRSPDFMVFRSKKAMVEYMKFAGVQENIINA